MLNTKQRAQLRAMANPLAVTLIIGKEGVTDAVERELDALLESHELVKGKVLESAMLTPRTVSEALCEATGADAVQCIGSKFVLYRQSSDEDKRKIVLVKCGREFSAVHSIRRIWDICTRRNSRTVR